MKLTSALRDLGHPIAYYPGLRKMTGSVTASILLCQLWYWRDTTGKEWIWKTRLQITKETGLSQHEQRTAKDVLIKMGILQIHYNRIEHKNEFKIDESELDKRWEEAQLREEFEEVETEEVDESTQEAVSNKDTRVRRTDADVKDTTEMIKDLYVNNPNIKKLNIKEQIESKIKVRLRVNPVTEDWSRFIEYAANRHIKDKEYIDKFIDWVITDGYNPKYYPPLKMLTMWPSAFSVPEADQREFVKKVPKVKEENYAPMPTGIITEKNN